MFDGDAFVASRTLVLARKQGETPALVVRAAVPAGCLASAALCGRRQPAMWRAQVDAEHEVEEVEVILEHATGRNILK